MIEKHVNLSRITYHVLCMYHTSRGDLPTEYANCERKREMDYQKAVDLYVRVLLDIATVLHTHREARAEFDTGFLLRIMHDGFLQSVTENDGIRLLHNPRNGGNFLLWQGVIGQQKTNWNCIGWIFPFDTNEEMERSYEVITRAELDQKPWPKFRQFTLSFRTQILGIPLKIPTNIVKVRAIGDECRAAMRILEKSPPNLRFVTKAVIDQLPPVNYLRKRIQIKPVVGEKYKPYVLMPR